jgi:hypothetical protein
MVPATPLHVAMTKAMIATISKEKVTAAARRVGATAIFPTPALRTKSMAVPKRTEKVLAFSDCKSQQIQPSLRLRPDEADLLTRLARRTPPALSQAQDSLWKEWEARQNLTNRLTAATNLMIVLARFTRALAGQVPPDIEQIIQVARVQELISTVGPATLLSLQTASSIIVARTRLLQESKLDFALSRELVALPATGPGLFNGRLAEVVKTYSDRATATSALVGDQFLITGLEHRGSSPKAQDARALAPTRPPIGLGRGRLEPGTWSRMRSTDPTEAEAEEPQ